MLLPSKSTIIGLFAAFAVLKTRTAFTVGDVVVFGSVVVVTSQGQPKITNYSQIPLTLI